jgi:uroporphyrinogen decarboxylase
MVEGGTSRDFHRAKLLMYQDPESFTELIDRIVAATVEYLLGQVAAGAEIVQLFDSWAGVLPEVPFRRWVIGPTRRIVEALRARHPQLPIIGFPRGAGALYHRYFSETGVTAVSLDTAFPVSEAQRSLQALGAVQGNLDPLLLVAGGAAMRTAVGEILGALCGGPFIFNLGHGIVPETPPEHVAELVALVRHG